MNRFNDKYGAIALVGLAAVYMVVSLVTGRSATSELPPDLRAPATGVDVWQATALLLNHPKAAGIETRSAQHFGMFHLPRSASKPGARKTDVLQAASGAEILLIVADTDTKATELSGHVSDSNKELKVDFFRDGVRAWYLTYVVPVPLFNENVQ